MGGGRADTVNDVAGELAIIEKCHCNSCVGFEEIFKPFRWFHISLIRFTQIKNNFRNYVALLYLLQARAVDSYGGSIPATSKLFS